MTVGAKNGLFEILIDCVFSNFFFRLIMRIWALVC